MKIDFYSGLSAYRPREGTHPGRVSNAGRSTYADVADFSRGSTGSQFERALMTAKSYIQNGVAAPENPERLEELTASVRDGSYYVSNEQLIRDILSRG